MQQEIEQVIYETLSARKWRHVPARKPLAHDVAVAVVGYLRTRPAAPDVQPEQGDESRTVVPKEALAAAVELVRKWKGYPHPDSIENTALIRSTTGILEAALSVARPAILAEALERTTMDECRDPETMKYQCPINVFMEKRLRRLTPQPAPADPRVEAVIASIRSAPDIGIYAGTDLAPFVCRMLAAADRAQKEAR